MASAADWRTVDVAVADPVGVGVEKPGVRDVLADVHDRHVVAGKCQDLVPSADRGDRAVLDEQGLRDRRLVHGHDLADDDDALARREGARWVSGPALVADVLGADDVDRCGESVLLGLQLMRTASTTTAAGNHARKRGGPVTSRPLVAAHCVRTSTSGRRV